jgi:CheY-like chemotaxis protein
MRLQSYFSVTHSWRNDFANAFLEFQIMSQLSGIAGQSISLTAFKVMNTITRATGKRESVASKASGEFSVSRGTFSAADDEDTVVEDDIATARRPTLGSCSSQAAPSRNGGNEPAIILVAISNEVQRRRFANAFRLAGYRTREATDGLSCLSKVRSTAFNMLVIDQHLLWGSGAGVIDVMRDDPLLQQIPVTLVNFSVTNEPDEQVPNCQREFGFDEVVHIVQQRLSGDT